MSTAVKTRISGTELSLEELRTQIDQVDSELVALLERRAQIVFSVGEYKRKRQMPIHDPGREAQIKTKIEKLTSQESLLSPIEMSSVFMTLVERFRKLEEVHVQKKQGQEALLDGSGPLNFKGPQNVVLWGFGLLGASFFLALQESVPQWNFWVIDPGINPAEFQKWKQHLNLKNIELGDENSLEKGDLIVLGAPVEVNLRHLRETTFPKHSVVIDLGSTKQAMIEAYQHRQAAGLVDFTFIGGHPLAGKEVAGFQSADALLFYNKVFCWVSPSEHELSPSLKNSLDALSLCLGAKPFWVSAKEHDQTLAWTSHLPQILSSVLASLLLSKKIARTSELFPGVITELLRVSGSSFSIWQSILASNQTEVKKALDELIDGLAKAQGQMDEYTSCQDLFHNSNQFYSQFTNQNRKKA